jgi:hypothetical protein
MHSNIYNIIIPNKIDAKTIIHLVKHLSKSSVYTIFQYNHLG